MKVTLTSLEKTLKIPKIHFVEIRVEHKNQCYIRRQELFSVHSFTWLKIYYCCLYSLQFGIYSAGLEALLGEEVEPGKEDQEATAGMSLDLLGVSLRPITFFTGQAGLLAAVWSAPPQLMSALQVGHLNVYHPSYSHASV